MKAFSIIAALATAVQAVALIMLHLLPTGYNPVRDAVSDYGVGRYRGWFWLQAVAGGVGRGSGTQQALKVKQSAASTATVHLDQGGNATTVHVHVGGLVFSRMVNEFGIA